MSAHAGFEIKVLPGLVSFAEGLEQQHLAFERVRRGEATGVVLLLEHEPVYTMGRRRDSISLSAATNLPYPVIETNRGGEGTYHGPGQLTGYVLVNLTSYGRDLHAHLRRLEEVLILTSAHFGVMASRQEGKTGVWVAERKLASIGVGVRQWITMHGFALNVRTECLKPFNAITPCGLVGVEMTALEREAHVDMSWPQLLALVSSHLQQQFDLEP